MALSVNRLPYGLRDVKVATLDSAGVKGTLIDFPNGQTLEFEESTNSQELRGDDTVVAQRVTIDSVSWTLEGGGYSLEAMVVIAGGTITTSGTTPAVQKKWRRMASDAYPDFFMEGQSIAESGGDSHIVLHRCKATQISGSHTDQDFWVTHAEGNAIGTLTAANVGAVWDFVDNETAIAIA
jgi:hypothetical protein